MADETQRGRCFYKEGGGDAFSQWEECRERIQNKCYSMPKQNEQVDGCLLLHT